MRIGIVTRRVGFNDGQARVNFEIAAEALRQGHQVDLFCEQADAAIVGIGATAKLIPPPSFLPSRLLKDQLFAWRTYSRLGHNFGGCDALLVNGFATWAPSDVNAVHFVHRSWLRSPHHAWQRGATLKSLYPRIYSGLNAGFERNAFKRTNAIVAVSNSVEQELIDAGVPREQITTVLAGVDAEEFSPGCAQPHVFGLPDGALTALFVGDIKSPRKNLDTVLRSLVDVPTLNLAVVGTYEGTPWPLMAAQLGISDRVKFLGFRKDIPVLMRAADLFVFPSRYEPFGLVILEALASGLPIVTARSTGAAQIITPEVGVVLSDTENAAVLAAELNALVADEGRRRDMATAARKLALTYSWPAMARKYVDILEKASRTRKALNG